MSLPGVWNMVRGIFEWRRQRRGMLTTNFAEAGGFIKSSPEEPIPDLQLHFVVGKLVDHGRKTVLGHGYSCHVCLLRPKSRGSLRLASADPQVAPLIDPAFLQDPDDTARLVRGFQVMRRCCSSRRWRATAAPSPAPPRWRRAMRRSSSSCATTPTPFTTRWARAAWGLDPMDVVDARLRVHGVAGLRVVDASVMPAVVGGNTNAPVIMMAEKAVDMILDDRLAALSHFRNHDHDSRTRRHPHRSPQELGV